MTTPTQFYFHGLPGCAAELDFALPNWQELGIIAPQRLALHPTHERAVKAMASQIASYESAHLIGFSLGAMSVLELAAALPETVTKLDLIAPAAPLELGDYLDQMAGKPIFEAAMKNRLSLITSGQAMMTRLSPDSVIKAMFSTAPKADKILLSREDMRIMLRVGLKHSLLNHQHAYKDELRAFVQPWAETLSRVICPVTIWHGTEDTWVALTMSHALRDTLGNHCKLNLLRGLGHYSALVETLSQITR